MVHGVVELPLNPNFTSSISGRALILINVFWNTVINHILSPNRLGVFG